ncbi:DNA replication factor Y [Bifidobacterium tsurumiense]|uniref:DNA replication factor Y n=1 Tax=Bifidobacterium tsurumiense TaxID=356829 RepID=A0A087EFL5_9BIFI|nr:DNA replication factor Y [Bifidobacterium tsurumiense]
MLSDQTAEQLALDGLAPRKRRSRAQTHTPAQHLPIARVVLDVQATHLGQSFDYLVDEKHADKAVPGCLVRVRFGGQRVNGVVWERVEHSATAASALRYIERVFDGGVLVPRSLREDITGIADAYGGTRANIIRLAVPPRVAYVEKEQQFAQRLSANPHGGRHIDTQQFATIDALVASSYAEISRLKQDFQARRFGSFVWNPLPGMGHWQSCVAWMVTSAMRNDRSSIVVLPGMREIEDVAQALGHLGLTVFAPTSSGRYDGDVAVLSAAMSPAERYRMYCAVASGQVRCVLGTRAAMYAPVEGEALFVIVDDMAYQQADGMMPYAHARGVLRLRAKRHQGIFVALSHARSAISAWECDGNAVETPVSGFSTSITALPSVNKERRAWVRWLNRDELFRLSDATVGVRVPHTAVSVLSKALLSGSVLLSIPQDGVNETLSCANCHRQARCPRCTGPLLQSSTQRTPRCLWCGLTVTNWRCPHCKHERMRTVRVGAAGTVQELMGLFRNIPIVVSSPSQPRGVIPSLDSKPRLVVATPGAEPRVRGRDGAPGEYRAVAILDAWTSLYALGVDARIDTLSAWMRVVSMCAPQSRGGQALVIGESDEGIVHALAHWDAASLANQELEERRQTALPPIYAAACVWGRREAVRTVLDEIGALTGDWSSLQTDSDVEPAVLGPVPIAPPRTVDARILEGTSDRVKAVVRVPQQRRAELALRLRKAQARHVANREPGELRFQLDPKDLM